MSKFLREPLYTGRGKENQWLNIIFQSHDMICGCPSAQQHLKHLFEQQECRHFRDTETTEETGGTTEKDELGIDAGDLENLFSTENDVDEG